VIDTILYGTTLTSRRFLCQPEWMRRCAVTIQRRHSLAE
jgi:hypothetical protein